MCKEQYKDDRQRGRLQKFVAANPPQTRHTNNNANNIRKSLQQKDKTDTAVVYIISANYMPLTQT